MKKIILILAFLVCASNVYAQNPVAGPTSKFAWTQGADILSDAQGYTYRMYLDVAGPATLTGVTCAGTTAPYTCQVLVPSMTQGTHSMTITATSAAGESAHSVPFAFAFVANPPQTPTGMRIIP